MISEHLPGTGAKQRNIGISALTALICMKAYSRRIPDGAGFVIRRENEKITKKKER